MSTELTPLEQLDDAIHEFARATGSLGAVGSWVVAYETSRVQSDDTQTLPLIHGTNYSIGPATSPATAVGLGRYVAGVAEHALISTAEDDQEDNQ